MCTSNGGKVMLCHTATHSEQHIDLSASFGQVWSGCIRSMTVSLTLLFRSLHLSARSMSSDVSKKRMLKQESRVDRLDRARLERLTREQTGQEIPARPLVRVKNCNTLAQCRILFEVFAQGVKIRFVHVLEKTLQRLLIHDYVSASYGLRVRKQNLKQNISQRCEVLGAKVSFDVARRIRTRSLSFPQQFVVDLGDQLGKSEVPDFHF
mmetsp:Transcript_9949/g.26497  ORF Transcript_9949/g.26497 Transcript_9949/m.26497 type:complete len:208 (-) Transcript_9949:2081-2704(-)